MKRILIVDDQPHIAKILTDVLQKTGYETHTAANGQAGIDSARTLKPDLIIMDVMMPIKTGFEATKEIKEDASMKEIPVVFLTAKGQDSDRTTAQELGAAGFITSARPKTVR